MRPAGVPLTAVAPGSAAERAGLKAGDLLLAVDGTPLSDAIDLVYATAEPRFTLTVQGPRGRLRRVTLERPSGVAWGGAVAPPPVKHCGNRCVFCFVDQMPSGLRPSLYVKDEDYRHSFLYGNYIALSNCTDADLERILRLRLSPLYISVHATDPEVRARLLGRKRPQPILPWLRRLGQGGIQLHTQIVLCPGWNDGAVLRRTIEDLAGMGPAVRSIAVVPVGLTRHRRGLTRLRPITLPWARQVLRQVQAWQERFWAERKTRLVWPTDEWYLRTRTPIPMAATYEGFPQLENGVGIVRNFLDDMTCALRHRPQKVEPRRLWLATGQLAAATVRQALRPLNRVRGLTLKVLGIPNRLFGASVGVTGLLSGQDLLAALAPRVHPGDGVLLSGEPLRHASTRFLDDLTVPALSRKLGVPVKVVRTPRELVRCALADWPQGRSRPRSLIHIRKR